MAHKAKEAADAVIAKAEATKVVAQDISNKLEALFLYTSTPLYTFTPSTTLYPTTFGRFRRQDASITATNYRTPVNCDDLKSTMTDLKNAMDYGAPDYDPAKATTIVSILTSLDLSELTLWCSSSDLSELFDAKNAAKDNADAVVTTQTMLISAKTDELNALVWLILALNHQISAAGGTTISPGTTATEGETSTTTTESGTTASTQVSTVDTEGEASTTTIGSEITASTRVSTVETEGEASTTTGTTATEGEE